MNDREIVTLYFERNERAIAETKNVYGNYLKKTAFNILGSLEDAEEAESDTYVRAWNVIPPQKPENLKIFLARIIRNLSIDMYRRRTAARRGGQGCDILLSELEEALPAYSKGVGAKSTEAAFDGSELTRAINDFLSGLDTKKRVMFVRRYWFGDPVADIAARLSVSESSVGTTLFRLRAALSAFLEEEGITV